MSAMVPEEWENRVRADLEACAPVPRIILFPGVLTQVDLPDGWYDALADADARIRAGMPDPLAELIGGRGWSPCQVCGGLRWVCEFHPGRPWGGMCCEGPRRARLLQRVRERLPYRGLLRLAWRIPVTCADGACHCGGAGQPCGACNPESADPGELR